MFDLTMTEMAIIESREMLMRGELLNLLDGNSDNCAAQFKCGRFYLYMRSKLDSLLPRLAIQYLEMRRDKLTTVDLGSLSNKDAPHLSLNLLSIEGRLRDCSKL